MAVFVEAAVKSLARDAESAHRFRLRHASLLRFELHDHARVRPSFHDASRLLRHLVVLAVLAAHGDIVRAFLLLRGRLACSFLPRMVSSGNVNASRTALPNMFFEVDSTQKVLQK